MYPVLIEIGSLKLYTYGLFVALGFVAALTVSKKTASRRNSLQSDLITDLFFIILLSGIIGARLFYVIVNFSYFREDPLAIIRIWEGGLVFYGGFILAVAGAMSYLKIRHLPFHATADVLAPGIAIGHAVGRIGCFFAGCCHGKASTLPIAVTFHHPDSLAPLDVGLHPTQLYSVAANFFIFLVLLFLVRIKKFHGMVFWTYVLLYSVTRYIIEIFRGDFRGQFLSLAISTSQGICILLFAVSLIMLGRLYKKT
ncbi:MAG: prolipoprotein diacylglyceryl transferase [Desulfarculaceae bacterium]|nr:prolipoprotein diacylglyceryl transferase [Desulfarculaceae bacterium]